MYEPLIKHLTKNERLVITSTMGCRIGNDTYFDTGCDADKLRLSELAYELTSFTYLGKFEYENGEVIYVLDSVENNLSFPSSISISTIVAMHGKVITI